MEVQPFLKHDENAPASPSLQDYLQILRRRRAIILQAFVLIGLVGVMVTLMTKPVYQSSAKLLVDERSLNMNTVDSANPLSSLLAVSQPQSVATQIEVLQSGPLVQQVFSQVGPTALDIEPEKDTNVIVVTAEGTNPRAVGDAPNLLLRLYIENDADQSLAEIRSAKQFCQKQDGLARVRLARAETALKSLKQMNHVQDLALDRSGLQTRLAALDASYQKAQTDLAVARTEAATDRALLARQPAVIAATQEATNPRRASLQSAMDDLRVQREGLVQRGGYAPQSGKIVALDAQLAEIGRQKAAQPLLVTTQSRGPNPERAALGAKIRDLQTQAASLEVQASGLKAQLALAQSAAGNIAGLETQYDRLAREQADAATQDKMFSDKLADLALREEAHHTTARIIARSQEPSVPVRPKKTQGILFAGLIGLLVGLGLALLQEFFDDRINSVDDASRVLGLPSLGVIPSLTEEDARLLPQMEVLASASEGYRMLRTNITFTAVDLPLRTLLVTSASPGEGKTTTAANLAFAMAMDGKKVILVDTDLRRPALHRLFNLPAVPGLTDVLLGQAAVKAFEIMPGLLLVTAGTAAPNPSELLNSRKFRNTVDLLVAQSDIVIFDSPPVLAAADAAILAAQMDGTVLVVETGETKKAAAVSALKLLRQARAALLGVAYNKVNTPGTGIPYYTVRAAPQDAKVPLALGASAVNEVLLGRQENVE